MITQFVHQILSLSGLPAYGLVALLAGGEAAFLLGLVIPGETALLLGGVLASRGQVSLGTMLLVAITAVIVGDSIGYEFGRHGGPRLRASWLGRRVGPERWAKGESFLNRRGGAAVLLGRWVGILRALVPSLAGMGRMPYRRFLFWNALGGILFATTIVMVGYAAGSQYTRVSHLIGRGGLTALGVVLVVVIGAHFYRSFNRSHRPRPVALRFTQATTGLQQAVSEPCDSGRASSSTATSRPGNLL